MSLLLLLGGCAPGGVLWGLHHVETACLGVEETDAAAVRSAAQAARWCETPKEVRGDLTVLDAEATDLGALSCVCAVHGTLELRDRDLERLDGLEGARAVANVLTTTLGDKPRTPYLEDISALFHLSQMQTLTLIGPASATLGEWEALTSIQAVTLGSSDAEALALPPNLEALPSLSLRELPELVDLRLPRGATTEALELWRLDSLLELRSLGALASIGGLTLEEAPELLDLEGLAGLEGEVTRLWLVELPRLRSLSGLGAVTRVTGDLVIEDCPSLQDIDALSGLRRVDGELSIGDAYDLAGPSARSGTALASLDGLASVQQVGALRLVRNKELRTLDALDGLLLVEGDLEITGNAALTSIAGLSALQRVDGDVVIRDNERLPARDIQAALAGVEVGGAVLVEGNR